MPAPRAGRLELDHFSPGTTSHFFHSIFFYFWLHFCPQPLMPKGYTYTALYRCTFIYLRRLVLVQRTYKTQCKIAVSVSCLTCHALDHNYCYATTTRFYTFVTSETFVELAKGIPEHISSLSTALLPRRYVSPKVGPSIGPRRRPDA